ncbi:branched-chain amino acid ABC transporter permease [Ensifer sp. ENS06]|uniref:branched-chain amino acid ABC transporter permease n=1 Tax=Ensifer sp. ENS06 TaxID=2769276 RepID=UPI00177ECF9A|nr:branched-chain amino acid ABC transporter permease [Ensifer sp. ENS06]MBD9627069.1 branched-chain amino acid ABC transporter permease [Ensifer sp. ENS06]
MTRLQFSVDRGGSYGMVVACLVVVGLLVLLPLFVGNATLRLATEMACYLILAMMWNMLAGYAGLMSIGQQVFVGLGGYTLFALSGPLGVPVLLALPLSALSALALSIPLAVVLFRLNGAYFAVGSWVVAEIVALIVAQSTQLGSGSGMSFPVSAARSLGTGSDRAATIWWCALGAAVVAQASVYLLLRSPRGLALMAMRDNAVAAGALGVRTVQNKVLVYGAAAFASGIAGAILFLVKLRISPAAAFDVNEWTASIIFIVVIGGLGHLEGPLIGVLVFFALRGLLSDLGAWYLIILGMVAIAVMLKAPTGLWGILQTRFNIELFPIRRSVLLRQSETSAFTRNKTS